MGTRWSSAFSDSQWLQVDLGARYTLSSVVLDWEWAYGRNYSIQISDDGTTWHTIANRRGWTGGTDTLNVNATGRYVRMMGHARGTPWGYSLWEFQVMGQPATAKPAQVLPRGP